MSSSFVFDQLESTNAFLLDQKGKVNTASYCLTEYQSQGKGRRGNTWVSSPNRNIMLSIAWTYPDWPEQLHAMSLAVGLVVAETLKELYSIDAQIKWPNDILLNEDKLAGILVELTGDASSACHLVVGIGLNCHQPEWPEQVDYKWTDLFSHGIKCDRNLLASKLIGNTIMLLRNYPLSGFKPLAKHWNELSSYAGKRIKVIHTDQQIVGRMLGVNENGELVLQTDDGESVFISDSNVSIRLAG